MNYRANAGTVCLQSDGSLIGELNFSENDFGPLDEDGGLDERATTTLSMGLQAMSCDFADPTLDPVPVTSYRCQDPDEPSSWSSIGRFYQMWTDGLTNVMRLGRGGRTTLTSLGPQDTLGIDWDCDGVIEAASTQDVNGAGGGVINFPGEPCDGIDNDGDGTVDENCGSAAGELVSREDWRFVPTPKPCIPVYTDSRSCWPIPMSYVEDVLAGSASCRGTNPDVECDDNPPIFDASSSLDEPARSIVAIQAEDSDCAGLPEDPLDALPGGYPAFEICDLSDNDGDGEIDEGCRDSDGDAVIDTADNCPRTPNADQLDANRNYIGDACERPDAPELFFSDAEPQGATLTWADGGMDVRGFNLFRRTNSEIDEAWVDSGSYPTIDGSATSYLDPVPGGNPGAYEYCLAALDRMGQEGERSCISFVTDVDGDQIFDDIDNCPFLADPDQTNSDALEAGDLCQCGDLDSNGSAEASDRDLIRKHLAGLATLSGEEFERCSVWNGSQMGDCSVVDLAVLQRYLNGQTNPVPQNDCFAYGG